MALESASVRLSPCGRVMLIWMNVFLLFAKVRMAKKENYHLKKALQMFVESTEKK